MDLSYQRLPSITIDEDLELDCNELPMFYFKVATLHRDNTFPTYNFKSNKTDGFATFTLDTSTSSEDNCPGFTFSDINVVFKGTQLNTSKISISESVKIKTDPKFELRTTISEIPLNLLSNFQGLSFCRLSIFDASNSNDFYPKEIELNLALKYAEAYMFSIDISDNSDVLFIDNDMIIDIFSKTKIIVHLPSIINYSNAFYFNLVKSEISFSISGDINYTDLFPHYLFINQDYYSVENINVTLNPGNYFTKEGTYFNTVNGERFSINLVAANLFWNNPMPAMSVVLSYSRLILLNDFQISAPSFFPTSFIYYGNFEIDGDLSISCNSLSIPEHLEPKEGCKIEITAAVIKDDAVDFNGDLYVTSEISSGVNVDQLFFVNSPHITSYVYTNPIHARRVNGKAQIMVTSILGEVGTSRTIICVDELDSLNVNDYSVVTDYVGAFVPVIIDKCLCVNKTKSTTQSLTVTVSEENTEWHSKFEPFQNRFTFSVTAPVCTIDLTVLSSCVSTVTVIFDAKKQCNVRIKIDQSSADKIKTMQIGSSTTPIEISWLQKVSIKFPITAYKGCNFNNLFKGIDITQMEYLNLKDFTQLGDIEPYAKDIKLICISSSTKIKNITFTSTGWRVYTINLPEDEELEIKGFNHPAILVMITSTNAFQITTFNRFINIGLETASPFPLYISIDTDLTAYMLGNEYWETSSFQPLIISTKATIVMPFEVFPVNFDDSKFENFINRVSSREILINRTNDRVQSIISLYSVFNLKYNLKISTVGVDNTLFFEINNEAVICGGGVSLTHSDNIFIVFRDKLIMDSNSATRTWRESNTIVLLDSSTLISPSFLDDISILWNCTDETRFKPSTIQSAINTNKFSFEFANVSQYEVSESFERFFNQPFQIANSVIDITCDELMERVAFVNGNSFNFSNKVISFDLICTDLIYATHPILFNQIGYQLPDFCSYIGLFLNRTLSVDENGTDRSGKNKELDPGIIACIVIGASTVVIIIVSLSVYFFKRRRSVHNLVD